MSAESRAPKAFQRFIARFPKLGEAWERIREAEADGPLDEKSRRLLKLAVAVGAMREGAVHSATRKALAAGASAEEILQVVALSASTLGMPSTVAIHSWVSDIVETDD